MEDGGGGQGSPCQSLHCVHLPTTLPFSVSFSSPSSVSPSAPGVCVADKRERRRRRQGVDMMLSVWAVCPAGPRTRSKGLNVVLPSSHSAFLPLSPHQHHHHTPQQEAFLWGRDSGPAGPGWTEDKDQAG